MDGVPLDRSPTRELPSGYTRPPSRGRSEENQRILIPSDFLSVDCAPYFIQKLAELGIPIPIVEKIEVLPNKANRCDIVKDLLICARMIAYPDTDDRMTALKLKSIVSRLQDDPDVGSHGITPSDGLEVQVRKLAELGISQCVLELIKPIRNNVAQRYIVEDFLSSTHEVIRNAFDDNPLIELKLNCILRIFQYDPAVRSDAIALNDVLALQIRTLAERGIPQRLLEMINAIPSEAAQHYIVEDFLMSTRTVIRNAFDYHLAELELKYVPRKVQHDPDIGGRSVPLDGSPDVHIVVPKEDNVPAEQKNPNPPPKEVVKSVADFIKKEGVQYLANPSNNVPGPQWAKTIMEVAKILGYAFTVAGHATRNYSNKLSRFLIKAGAIATALAVILVLVMPLQPVVAWIVGLITGLIVVSSILSD